MFHFFGDGDEYRLHGISGSINMYLQSRQSLNFTLQGSLGGAVVWRLPLAQGAILEAQDQIPCWALGAWSLLLLLPVSLPLSLSVTIINKNLKKKKGTDI